MTTAEILSELKSKANPANAAGMARFGSRPKVTALGINIPTLRAMAKKIGKNHPLARELWVSGFHEARLLAGFIADPKQTDEKLMEKWVKDFDSWDVCDQVCYSLFDKTALPYPKAAEWTHRPEEYIRRAGFALMAALAVHDKKADDDAFVAFFPLIDYYSTDERNFVRKAVNWALRQIGKRNVSLNKKCIHFAEKIVLKPDRSSRWIAKDALRELRSEAVQKRLK